MCSCNICEAIDKCVNGKVPKEEEVLMACRYDNPFQYMCVVMNIEAVE